MKYNYMNQWVYWGYVENQGWLKCSYIAKAHSSMDDNTQKLGPWSSLYDL